MGIQVRLQPTSSALKATLYLKLIEKGYFLSPLFLGTRPGRVLDRTPPFNLTDHAAESMSTRKLGAM